jgi:hypothetical protein
VCPWQCVIVGGSSEVVAAQRGEHLDDIIGPGCLDDVMGVGQDGEGLDEAEER